MIPQQGFFWHVHHDKLLEWCFNYEERAEFIRRRKSPNEQEIRFRLFQPVKGMPQEVIEARQAYNEAERAYDETGRVYNKAAGQEAYDKAEWALDKAGQVYDKAELAYDKALTRNMPEIQALHAVECPNCPWDGHTIFPTHK